MLSNTAIPRYYGEFRDRVLNGDVMICNEIALEMNRIDELIRDPGIFYDDEAVEAWIAFCEEELVLTDGSDLKLLDSFKLWGEQLFGWYYFEERSVFNKKLRIFERKLEKKRLIKKLYLIVGRGAAKSFFSSCVQAYYLTVDPATTNQVTVAPTMKQAEEVTNPIKTAIIRSKGPYFKFLTEGSLNNTTGSKANRCKLASTKLGIQNFLTGSILEIVPMTTDKVQGRKDKVASIDEWLSTDIREDIVGPLEQGCSKNDDYIIIATSSEGTVRNGPGDDIKLELSQILRGEMKARHISIFWYKLDDIKEVSDPRMWEKANPNIGLTMSYEAYKQDVERAEAVPSARNDIFAKRFGIPSEGYTYFFTFEETIPHSMRDFWKMPCSLGADLSQGDDFCAFTFLFPLPNDCFGVKTRSYISSRTLYKLAPSMRQKYDQFMLEGSLIVLEGTVLDMMEVYDDLDRYILQKEYEVMCIGYDPYNSQAFMQRWELENSSYGVVKVPQGVKTESVPLGEIKDLAEDRKLIFDQLLMQFAMGNCIALEDTNGNRKLLKKRYDEKIDNVAAMLDAYVAYKLNLDSFG